MSRIKPVYIIFVYLWVSPYTLIGLLGAFVALLTGASLKIRMGVMEVTGGWMGKLYSKNKHKPAISTITLGHVIFSASASSMGSLRNHEHIHVMQYQQWGILFVPLYLVSSLIQWLRCRDPYRDNFFEKKAFSAKK